ncbi:MAG: HD-GYP domain-containing protein [Gammaproteobacteria bacterium]
MKDMKQQANELHCEVCGKLLEVTASYISHDKAYCCEGCYLAALTQHETQQQHDQTYLVLAESLVAALDAREHETALHSKRVACHTQILARQFTNDRYYLQQIYLGALLHDIGKIAIPDTILLKNGPLTETEWTVMHSHPQRGYDIVSALPFMQVATQIILCHEERYDGGGYPEGLAGEAIPWGARIFAVIDTLDAMTNDRTYRKAMDFDVALDEIIKQAGHQFDPKAVDALLAEQEKLREMVAIKCAMKPDL